MNTRNFIPELKLSSSRSSGPGGQNVNKVNSKVELRFHIESSVLLNEYEKNLIRTKLKNRINSNDELIIEAQTERSQFKNKEIAIERFNRLVLQALIRTKKRISTKPSKASIERRIQLKKKIAERKKNRRKDCSW